MTNMPKPRGRPKGDGVDDRKMLTAVADMIAANPTLKPTTAMRRIKRDASDSEIRRWQDKWRQRKEVLLPEAHVRLEDRKHPQSIRASIWAIQQTAEKLAAAGKMSGLSAIALANQPHPQSALEFVMQSMRLPETLFYNEISKNPLILLAHRNKSIFELHSGISNFSDKFIANALRLSPPRE